ncbi:MAG: glycosyltransferase [Thermodesulfobacteriota bacterium]
MRILHCGKFFPPDRGGMETFLRDLAMAQAAAGDRVLVLANAGAAPAGREDAQPGLTVVRSKVAFVAGGYAPVAPGLPLRLIQAALFFRPHVLHLHAPNAAALWPLLLHLRAPLVAHWHADVSFPPERRPSAALLAAWRGLERWMLRRADAVVATSPQYLASSPALARFRDKCRVVPLGLAEPANPGEAGREHPAAVFLRAAPGLKVLAVGRLSHYKGLEVLCRAAALVPEFSVCLVGEGEERPALERAVAGLGLAGRVFLAGGLDDAAVSACYAACDVLCLPSLSRSEAFGMVLLEAMARGKPCVASAVDGGGPGYVVRDGETGLLVPPGDPEALARALDRLARDARLRARLGAAGRERFAAHFRMERVAAALREVYAGARARRYPLSPREDAAP